MAEKDGAESEWRFLDGENEKNSIVRIALLDDDEEFLKEYKKLLKNICARIMGNFEIMEFTGAEKVIATHKEKPFKILFFDIDMYGVNKAGFKVAEQIRKISQNVYVVFVTSHNELVFESFDFKPFNFLVKDEGKLLEIKTENVLKRILNELSSNKRLFVTGASGKKYTINSDDIWYITSSSHYVEFHMRRNIAFKLRKGISEIEKDMKQMDFVRIARVEMINMSRVIVFDKFFTQAKLKQRGTGVNDSDITDDRDFYKESNDYEEHLVSRRYRKQVMQAYEAYINRSW